MRVKYPNALTTLKIHVDEMNSGKHGKRFKAQCDVKAKHGSLTAG